MKNKIFLFPISLAVIFFASIIIIFSPVGKKNIIDISESTDGKIYINEKYNFEFKIPTDWAANEKPPYYIYFGKIGESYYYEGSESEGAIIISVEKKKPNENLDTIFKSYYEGFLKDSDKTIQKIKLGGIDAGYFKYFATTAFTIKDNYLITIQITAYPENDSIANTEKVFQQILSTFKFIN